MQCDLLVVGAGPAGAAAALRAARTGLHVVLADTEATPAPRPGESLGPTALPLLTNLGARAALENASRAAYAGFWRDLPEAPARWVTLFDADGRAGEGRHVDRATFSQGLREAARAAGVRLVVGSPVRAPRLEAGRVTGARLGEEDVTARWVVDASGRRQWLQHRLRLTRRAHGPRRRVAWGQVVGPSGLDEAPRFASTPDGWTWVAGVGEGRWSWVRCSSRAAPLRTAPAPLDGLPPCGPHGAADLTWRSTRPLAGPGWILAGEAGTLLDPSAGDGVARALEGGILAAECVARCLARPSFEALELARYDDQVMRGFEARLAQTRQLRAWIGTAL